MATSKIKTSKKKENKNSKTNIHQFDIHSLLNQNFGFDAFRGTQEEAINSLLNGHDTFVIMPTGGGKSLCYQLPALIKEGCAIIVSPLIALMKNQVDLVRSYSEKDAVAHFLNSSLNKAQITEVKADLLNGKTKLLYVAPETLTKADNLSFFCDLKISFFAVDEAHCISEWGHDFRPDYRKIRETIDCINPKLPLIALTATATPKVQSDILKNLALKAPNVFISSFNRPNLYYEIQPKVKKEQTIKNIVRFISQNTGKSGIIYTLNRKTTEELAELLVANNIKAVAYHAGLDSRLRAERQDQFLKEDVQIIVATIAFGMGIDKPDIRFVIHFNIPKSIENYYQETGRAGRDGLEGKCILYYSHKDVSKLEHLMREKPLTEREIGAQLIRETLSLAETTSCRRKVLMHYFGEPWLIENCGNCDNCLFPKEQIEVKKECLLVLQTIEHLDEKFTSDYIINVILGRLTPQISMYSHHLNKFFGLGKYQDLNFWQSLISRMLLDDFLKKDIEDYGVLKLDNKAFTFKKNPSSYKISINNLFENANEDDDDSVEVAQGSSVDNDLFEKLKNLRNDVAKKKNLPPFVIFLESSLHDMATLYPTTLNELEKCQGVSKGKAIKFGNPFLELIENYVVENEIDKPDEFIMRSVVNKSNNKIYIIQNVDKKIPLETISKNKNLALDSLLEEMETIVASGTRLNLKYAIDDLLDENEQEEIIDYFKNCNTSSLDVAKQELLDGNYSHQQLKIMRIKFLSEVGN